MRKILLIVSLIISSSSIAQITITRTDFGSIGDKIYYAFDSTVSSTVSPGSAGANQKWNFKIVMAADYYDSAMFTDASSDPKAPVGTNLRVIEGIDTQYMIVNTSFVRILMPAPSPFTGIINLKMLQFPLMYSSQYLDSSGLIARGTPTDFGQSIPLLDSMMIVLKVNMVVTCDGWGTIITPIDSVNVLRLKNVTTPYVTIYGKNIITHQWSLLQTQNQSKSVSFSWVTNGAKDVIAEASMDSTGTVIQQFKYHVLKVPVIDHTGINLVSARDAKISIYPNPVSEDLNVFIPDNNGKSNIQLFDMNGRVVKDSEFVGMNIRLNMRDQSEGIYQCIITRDHGAMMYGKVIVKR